MSGLNMNALKDAEKDLNARGGGGFFVRLQQDEVKDIRILEPTPSMNGIYYIEVPIWWIGGKPITSPEFIGEGDFVQTLIDAWEKEFSTDAAGKEDAGGAAEFKLLRNAKKGFNAQVSKSTAFWIPILEFDWTIGEEGEEEGQILGIYDDKGNPDPVKIKAFIKENKVRILDAKISLVKSINSVLTSGRGGAKFLNQVDGINMRIERKGKERDTRYAAQKDDVFPMPAEFYGPDALDPVVKAKSTIMTNEYITKVVDNYFGGEELPDEVEYRFPELRNKDEDDPKPAATNRRRRGAAAASELKQNDNAPAAAEPKAEVTPEPVAKAPRKRRNLVDDVANAK